MTINIFVYGTLREWGPEGLAQHYFTRSQYDNRRAAWTRGRLYSTGAFPVLVPGDDRVYGDIVTVTPPFDDYRFLTRMEVSAGYYVTSVDAHTEQGPVECQAFLLEPDKLEPYWPRVPGDDWHRADELPPVKNPSRIA